MQYLILQHPGHNRVYYDNSRQLALAELELAAARLEQPALQCGIAELAGLPYLALETSEALSDSDLRMLSGLSFVFAIYRREDPASSQLLPLERTYRTAVDEKISSLLKYPGKTNELFTRFMISVASLAYASGPVHATDIDQRSDPAHGSGAADPAGAKGKSHPDNTEEYLGLNPPLELLDPVCGRATTLFEGLIRGFRVTGIEQDRRAVHEAGIFFKKYLEGERYKHSDQTRRIAGGSRSDATEIREFHFAPDKAVFKDEKRRMQLGLVCGDAARADRYFNTKRFHLIVGDLPYGIAHESRSNAGGKRQAKAAGSRNPSHFLEACLPAWESILHPGGIIALAWNSFLVSHKKLGEIFSAAGFRVLDEPPYTDFEHRVDQSIKRDLILACKA